MYGNQHDLPRPGLLIAHRASDDFEWAAMRSEQVAVKSRGKGCDNQAFESPQPLVPNPYSQ